VRKEVVQRPVVIGIALKAVGPDRLEAELEAVDLVRNAKLARRSCSVSATTSRNSSSNSRTRRSPSTLRRSGAYEFERRSATTGIHISFSG
jgi:hypothetical protein